MQELPVYLDYAASAPARRESLEAQASYDAQPWAGANPNSLHGFGRCAFSALGKARAGLARTIGASRPDEVVLTSGGSESNALALLGIARAVRDASAGRRNRVVVSAIEHDSVLACARDAFAGDDWELSVVGCTPQGTVDLDELRGTLSEKVALVSVMAVNNELGSIQPVGEVAKLAHACGAMCHTDAVQALGRIPCDVAAWGVDAASFAAHKVGGPVGIGALYVRARTPLKPIFSGGGQEAGRRAGTVDVRGALAFAAAAAAASSDLDVRATAMRLTADAIVSGCCEGDGAPAATTLGPDANVAPGFVHLIVAGHQSEGLIVALDAAGFEVSAGSACSSASLEPSHVLAALGVPRDLAFCALRVTFDDRVAPQEGAAFARALRDVCANEATRRSRKRTR